MCKWWKSLLPALALTAGLTTTATAQVDTVQLAALPGDRWLTTWHARNAWISTVWNVGTLGEFPRQAHPYADPGADRLGLLGGPTGTMLFAHSVDVGPKYPTYVPDRVWADDVDPNGALVSTTTLATVHGGMTGHAGDVDRQTGVQTFAWSDRTGSFYRSRGDASPWSDVTRLGPAGFEVTGVTRVHGQIAAVGRMHHRRGWAIVVGRRLVAHKALRYNPQTAIAGGDKGFVVLVSDRNAAALCLTPSGRIRGRRAGGAGDALGVDAAGRAIVVASSLRGKLETVQARWLGPTCHQTRRQTLWQGHGPTVDSPAAPWPAYVHVTVSPRGHAVVDLQIWRDHVADLQLGFGTTQSSFAQVSAPLSASNTELGGLAPDPPAVVADGDAATVAWTRDGYVYLQRWTAGGAAAPPVIVAP